MRSLPARPRLVDEVNLLILQAEPIVANLEVLVDRTDALFVRVHRHRRPDLALNLLAAAEAEEAAAALLPVRSSLEATARLAQVVDRRVHVVRLLRDRLARHRARPQAHRPEDAVNGALGLEVGLDGRPIASENGLLEA